MCLGLCLNHPGKGFRADTGLAEWAGLRWLKFPPNSVFPLWAHTQHWALELQVELRTCKFSKSQYLPQGKRTGQPARCFGNKLVTNWKVLIQWSNNVQTCLAFPIHSVRLSSAYKEVQAGFCQFLHKLHEHLCKAQWPIQKAIIHYNAKLLFLK